MPTAVDVSILFGLALLSGSLLPASPAPTAAAVVVSLALLRPHLSVRLCAAAVVVVAMGALRVGRAVQRFDDQRAALRDALGGPARCSAHARVVSSPVLVHPSGAGDFLLPTWQADLSRVDCEGRLVTPDFRARVYGGPDDLARGDRLEVIVNLAPAQLFRNEGLDDPRPRAARHGVVASGGTEDVRRVERGVGLFAGIDRFRARVRRRINATFEVEAAPMARALVLGESDLDPADDRAFRQSGLAHLLAVSGTHLIIVVAGAMRALVALLRRVEWASARWDVGRWGAAFGIALAWVYADFAGSSGSANRAAAMLSFALGARALGRQPNTQRAFGFSLTSAALVEPLVAFDLSFLLSVAATGGLLVLQRPLATRIASFLSARPSIEAPRRALQSIIEAVATTVAATIGCAPLIAFIAPTLPLGGVAANVLAVPIGELVALPLCLAHALLAGLPPVERGDALVASGSLLVVRAIARVTEQASWLAVPVPRPSAWQCFVVWVVMVACFRVRPRRRVPVVFAGVALFALCEGAAIRLGSPRDKLRITVLDVGQGDASIIDFPDGQAMLVDGGGLVGSPVDTGRAIVAPILRARRRSELAAVVLTHPHPDHFGGLSSALEGIRVGEFWDTGQGEREGAGPVYAALLAALRGRSVPILRPASLCGHVRPFGAATIEVLAPCPEAKPFVNANDNSFVLRVSFGKRAALLVGDAERDEENALLVDRRDSLPADFLKVGHHGSATSSSPAFVEAIGARDAAISCGVRNRFGHPHPAALQTLSAFLHVHRTDRDGSIRWETDGASTTVEVAVRPYAAP